MIKEITHDSDVYTFVHTIDEYKDGNDCSYEIAVFKIENTVNEATIICMSERTSKAGRSSIPARLRDSISNEGLFKNNKYFRFVLWNERRKELYLCFDHFANTNKITKTFENSVRVYNTDFECKKIALNFISALIHSSRDFIIEKAGYAHLLFNPQLETFNLDNSLQVTVNFFLNFSDIGKNGVYSKKQGWETKEGRNKLVATKAARYVFFILAHDIIYNENEIALKEDKTNISISDPEAKYMTTDVSAYVKLDDLKQHIEREDFADLSKLEIYIREMTDIHEMKTGFIKSFLSFYRDLTIKGLEHKFVIGVVALFIGISIAVIILLNQTIFRASRQEDVFNIHRIGDVDLGG